MDEYNIVIHKEARQYLESIETDVSYRCYIAEQLQLKIVTPENHTYVKDEQLNLMGYRFILIENYIVLFVIKDNVIQIRRILQNKRQYKGLLY